MTRSSSSLEPGRTRFALLLSEARSGSLEAMGEILETFRPVLYREAGRRLSRRLARKESASDLVQQTLMMAFRHLGSFRGQTPEEFAAWLGKVGAHRWTALRRRYETSLKRGLIREASIGTDRVARAVEALADRGPSPSEHARRRERLEVLDRAIGRLSAEDRCLIRWKHRDKLGPTEIGRHLGCSPDAAGMRVKRAEEQLRRILGDQYDPR